MTRAVVFLAVGCVLLLANIWFVRAAIESFGRSGVVIAPIEVIGADTVAGRSLANLLQARLQQLQNNLQRTQERLAAAPPSAPRPTAAQSGTNDSNKPAPPMPQFWTEPIRLNSALFEPIEISATVGGVDVGRLVPWMQRIVAEPQTLNFTVSFESGHALVSGDIRALGTSDSSIWLETSDTTPAKIADLIAHELILQQLASDDRTRFGVLDVQEFQVLSMALMDAARLNERIARGRPVRNELAALLPGLEKLVEKVPNWTELLVFAGTIAEGAGASEKALSFYTHLDAALASSTSPADRERRTALTAKIAELRTALPEGFYSGLGRRIVAVTGVFEVGSDSPDVVFGSVSGDIAKHDDIFFGAAQWNFRTKTLGPLLEAFENADPDLFARAVGDGRAELEAAVSGTPESAASFARRIQDERMHVLEPWASRFRALGNEPTFQDVQMRTIEPFFRRAVALADAFGLRSERGLAQAYNLVIQQGGGRVRQRWPAALDDFRREKGREPSEIERMRILADLATPTRFSEGIQRAIHARFATFADGKSPRVDLEERDIRLVDFRTGEPLHDPNGN